MHNYTLYAALLIMTFRYFIPRSFSALLYFAAF